MRWDGEEWGHAGTDPSLEPWPHPPSPLDAHALRAPIPPLGVPALRERVGAVGSGPGWLEDGGAVPVDE